MVQDYGAGASSSYADLLGALRPKKSAEPNRKRQKLSHSNSEVATQPWDAVSHSTARREDANAGKNIDGPHVDVANGDVETEEASDAVNGYSEGEDDEDSKDPFEQHFSTISVSDVQAQVSENSTSKSTVKPSTSTISDTIRRTWTAYGKAQSGPGSIRKAADMKLKQRIHAPASELLKFLSAMERDVAGAVFGYHDVLVGNRTPANSSRLRDLCVVHALNHAFKTRDRVLKNTTKLAQHGDDDLELRDQGFTRPKILFLLPTKQSCVRFMDAIIKYSEPEQQENKARFLETFSREDTEEWSEKPEDFQELFGGNHEEDFRIGLKFTRKTTKYFSGFYNSDIILCSPLGLFRAISSGGSKDEKKAPDSDFLSSIEIVVVDHASALQMQNWQHVESAFSYLNAIPKESHGSDFGRVKHWYLDGFAKYLRQTIILSAYLTPEINALASTHLHNIAGRVKYTPIHNGAMVEVGSATPIPISQTFVRFESPSLVKESDARLKYFCASTIPQLARDKDSKGVLVFVPAYADFTRLRNHMTNSADSTSISFGSISEYTSVKDTARARSYLLSGRNSVLLYTERAHHHFRYKLKGVRKVIFYGIPDNPVFWNEIVGLLGINRDLLDGSANGGKGSVRAMFSKWDVLKLERVVGTDRVGRLLSERSGDVFDFV